MAAQQRPQVERTGTMNPAMNPANTNVPVTPAGDDQGNSAYFEPRRQSPSPTQNHAPSSGTAGPRWSANSSRGPTDKLQEMASSPSQAAAGAQSGEELLRRLSLAGQRPQKPELADVDPRAAHPDLHLSGHVISATFCVPYNVAHAPGCEWVLQSPWISCQDTY